MATDPITRLREQIGEATRLPSPQPYARTAEPLERLLQSIDDARNGRLPAEEVATKSAANTNSIAPQPSSTQTGSPRPGAAHPAGPVDAVVGQQILKVLEGKPLSGEGRAEAVRRLSLAMQNPSTSNLEAVLDVLLTGDPGSGQTRDP